jgi:hypothetical protein
MNKITFLILTISLLLIAISANAIELYSCTDRDGSQIVTSTPQDGMTNCVLKDSDEDTASSKNATASSQRRTGVKRASDPECDSIPGIMNQARAYLNRAANRSTSEMEAGKEDLQQAIPYLEEAESKSQSCHCQPLTSQIATAAQFCRQATYVNVVSIFSDYLTRANSAFNASIEAYNQCK